MDNVKLKNGSEEFGPLVAATMQTIRKLHEEKPIVLIDLIQFANDSTYEIFPPCRVDLERLSLINGKSMHDSIRNIVLSALSIEDEFFVRLQDPRA